MATKIALAILGLVLASGSSLSAQAPLVARAMPPDEVRWAAVQFFRAYDAARELITLEVAIPVVEEVVIREIAPDGTPVDNVSFKTIEVIERREYSLTGARAMNPKGAALKIEEVLNGLEENHPVIVLSPEQKLPVAYQKLLRDDAIVLQLPAVARRPVPGPDDRPRLTAPPLEPGAPPQRRPRQLPIAPPNSNLPK